MIQARACARTHSHKHTQLITIANFSAITVTSLTPISVSNSNSHPAQLTHDMPSAFALGIIFLIGKSQFLHHINQLKEPNTILIFNTKTYFSTASAHPWAEAQCAPPPFGFWSSQKAWFGDRVSRLNYFLPFTDVYFCVC